jgi:hypothetical protein
VSQKQGRRKIPKKKKKKKTFIIIYIYIYIYICNFIFCCFFFQWNLLVCFWCLGVVQRRHRHPFSTIATLSSFNYLWGNFHSWAFILKNSHGPDGWCLFVSLSWFGERMMSNVVHFVLIDHEFHKWFVPLVFWLLSQWLNLCNWNKV